MEAIYLTITIFVLVLGISLTANGFIRNKRFIRFQARPAKRLKEVIESMQDYSADEVFLSAGINLSIAKYTALRNLIAIVSIIYLLVKIFLVGIIAVRGPLLIIMFTYFITAPKEYYGKKKKTTPFKLVLNAMKRRYQDKKDNELMNLITQLKNMIITQSDCPKSADYIIETLMKFSKYTTPVFMSTLSLIRRGETDEASRNFAKKFDTKLGSDFSTIIAKLDALNPAELLTQIEAFQSGIKEERRTKRIREQENNGHRVFAFASVLVAIVLLDYLYILFVYLMTKMNS